MSRRLLHVCRFAILMSEEPTMEKNVHRFDGLAQTYANYRERYAPEIVLSRLRDWCGLTPKWTIADIGAGTGMLADVFLANGNRVLAVEPNAGMRRMCAELHAGDARLTMVDGTAEVTGIADGSAEMVAVGRALHWFDVPRAMEEFRRILKPDGWVAIVAFGRSMEGREENAEFEKVLGERVAQKVDIGAVRKIYDKVREILPQDFRHEEIHGTMTLTWDELYGMAMSMSSAPRPGDVLHVPFEQGFREYFEHYAVGGVVTLDTRYWINVGRFSTR